MKPAFFLDRDGTINIDRVYINDPFLLELIPGSALAIAEIQRRGYLVIIVTNQSGIGRGLIEVDELPRIHARLDELLLKESGARIDAYMVCPHHPDQACACRKPGVALVEEAIQKYQVDRKRSFFVGDSVSDVQAGQRAQCTSILVRTGKGRIAERAFQQEADLAAEKPDFIADDLRAAVAWALER